MAKWIEFECAVCCDWRGRIRVKDNEDVALRLREWGRAHNLETSNPFGMLKVVKSYPAVGPEPKSDIERVMKDSQGRRQSGSHLTKGAAND